MYAEVDGMSTTEHLDILFEHGPKRGLITGPKWKLELKSVWPTYADKIIHIQMLIEEDLRPFLNRKNTPTTRADIIEKLRARSDIELGPAFGCIPAHDIPSAVKINYAMRFPDVRFWISFLWGV
jgi:hypothetical protein